MTENYTGCMEQEYSTYVNKSTDIDNSIDWHKLKAYICSEGQWTEQAADNLVLIVQDYGSFFLKNAYALAIAAKIEDGRLGF